MGGDPHLFALPRSTSEARPRGPTADQLLLLIEMRRRDESPDPRVADSLPPERPAHSYARSQALSLEELPWLRLSTCSELGRGRPDLLGVSALHPAEPSTCRRLIESAPPPGLGPSALTPPRAP